MEGRVDCGCGTLRLFMAEQVISLTSIQHGSNTSGNKVIKEGKRKMDEDREKKVKSKQNLLNQGHGPVGKETMMTPPPAPIANLIASHGINMLGMGYIHPYQMSPPTMSLYPQSLNYHPYQMSPLTMSLYPQSLNYSFNCFSGVSGEDHL